MLKYPMVTIVKLGKSKLVYLYIYKYIYRYLNTRTGLLLTSYTMTNSYTISLLIYHCNTSE